MMSWIIERPEVKKRARIRPPERAPTRPLAGDLGRPLDMRLEATIAPPITMRRTANAFTEISMFVNTYQPIPKPTRRPPSPRAAVLLKSAHRGYRT